MMSQFIDQLIKICSCDVDMTKRNADGIFR